jgi:hypothetical protein
LEDLYSCLCDFQAVSLRFSGRLIGRRSSNVAIRRNHHSQIRKTLFRRTVNGEGDFPHFDNPLLSRAALLGLDGEVAQSAVKVAAVFKLNSLKPIGNVIYANGLVAIVKGLTVSLRNINAAHLAAL